MHIFPKDWPGVRVTGYRNSTPRVVDVVGVGPRARDLVGRLGAELPNLRVADRPRLEASPPGAEPAHPNLTVVVHVSGDPTDAFPVPQRPPSSLSFVVIEPLDRMHAGRDPALADLRAAADLLVTTPDEDFLRDLVANLSS
ncbi:hypothetical protein [Prosthecomicrobium sp. N25]|uniref:hypothetical protein n=1 Tax=Prosthecomicrobium sp. N25 TaxID=3129254 RepID=UPI00307712C3